jgi:hypothetical protein
LFLDISKGKMASEFMSELQVRISRVFMGVAVRRHLSEEQLASVWLKDMKSGSPGRWDHLRDAGLCGSQSPRGVIFALILQCLCKYAPEANELSLVSFFRSKFSKDPGLDGCLMELEEILKLKSNIPIGAVLLSFIDEGWAVEEKVNLPSNRTPMTIFLYHESNATLENSTNSEVSNWALIQVPSGFDVIDVVVVELSDRPVIYGIQITRAARPFAKHHTFDTCLPPSKKRLEKLWGVIFHRFQLDASAVEVKYLMLAPNCERDEFKPPAGHHSDYYFAPARIAADYSPSKSRKRFGHPVSARQSRAKKECCKCTSGTS